MKPYTLLSTIFISLLFMTACSNERIDYAGQYTATTGDLCVPEKTDSINAITTVIEIIQQGKGSSATYIANVPMAAAMNMPTVSLPASINDNGELHFIFHEPGKSGLFGGEPSIDVTMVVKPNKSKENHLWLSRWEAVMTMLGKTQKISPLESMRQSTAGYDETIISEKGLCLAKLTNT